MSFQSHAFLRLLTQCVDDKLKSCEDVDNLWHSSANWTKLMIGNGESRADNDFGILGEMGSLLGYKPQAEYLRVDQIWYSLSSIEPSKWYIDVFLEHENNSSRLIETVNKLLHLSAGLKIVITYLGSDSPDKNLSSVSDCIKTTFGLTTSLTLLVVFGYQEGGRVRWILHEFDGLGRSMEVSCNLATKA